VDSDNLRIESPSRSLSLTPDLDLEPTPTVATAKSSTPGKRALTPSDTGTYRHTSSRGPPAAKRSKPTYDTVLDSHVKETLGAANPLGRKAVKQKSKRDKKAARKATRTQGEGMLVDVDDLAHVREVAAFTFSAPDQA
jgi:hypothetical protein